jgi:hypothetical protein
MERAEAEAILDGDRETALALLMRVGELIEANRRLEARVAELEQRLNRSSRNSSLPPSQDPLSAPPRAGKPGSGRRAGGQPGHEGRNRSVFPLEQVDEVVEHWPERCHACARRFAEDERIDATAPQRHQVAELPPIAVRVSEQRLHRLRCPACSAETRAQLAAGVPRGAFGPRLQAAVTTLAVRNRVSRRDSSELVRELFGAELSAGSVDAIVHRAGEALEQAHARRADQIRSAPAVNIDETGWRLRGGKRTLWGALTSRAAVFRIAADRHEREVKALLGEHFAGIACSDRCWAYDYLDPERRQLCSAHLVRDFTAHSEGLGAQQDFGAAGLAIAGGVFAAGTPLGPKVIEPACSNGSPRSSRSSGRCSSKRRARARRRRTTASSPPTCSNAGRRSRPSPPSTASSRPTTTPSAASAAPSSTASSRSAANPSRASARSSGSSQPQSPAACRGVRSSPTSPTSSTPASEATPYPPSHDLAGDLT